MKRFCLLFFLAVHAQAKLKIQAGDVILLSFNCYECQVIEDETSSAYSHSGVVLDSAHVAQALSTVSAVSIDEFLHNRRPNTKAAVYRPYEKINEERLKEIFFRDFSGAFFDGQYLWDNVDQRGREKYYCSEFVAKILDHFLSTPSPLRILSYRKNEAYWFKYFKGHIPEGVWGNSPSSFEDDARFYLVGTL